MRDTPLSRGRDFNDKNVNSQGSLHLDFEVDLMYVDTFIAPVTHLADYEGCLRPTVQWQTDSSHP